MLKLRRMFKKNPTPDDSIGLKLYGPCLLLFAIFLLSAYLLVAFARPLTVSKHFHAIMVLLTTTVFGPLGVAVPYMWLRRTSVAALESALGQEKKDKKNFVESVVARAKEKAKDQEHIADLIIKELSEGGLETDKLKAVQLLRVVEPLLTKINFAFWALVLISVFSLLLALYVFKEEYRVLGEMLGEGGYLYFGLLVIIGLLLWRWDFRREQRKITHPESVTTMAVLTFTLVAALGFLAVLFFAARVYCYIPAFKGGGDFTTESQAVLHFDPRFSSSLPSQIMDSSKTNQQSLPVFILQQNTHAYFLALTNSANNPNTWRLVGRTNKPTTIYTVGREAVLATSYDYGGKP